MTVYAVMRYCEAIGIWELGDIYITEEKAKANAIQYNRIWGNGHAYVITREVQ